MAEYKTIEFTLSSASWTGTGTVEITVEDNYDIVSNTSTLRVTRVRYKAANYGGTAAAVDGKVLINGNDAAIITNAWITQSTSYVDAAITSASPIAAVHNNDGSLSVSITLAKNSAAYPGFAVYMSAYPSLTLSSTETKTLTLTTQPRASSIASCTAAVNTLGNIALTMNRKIANATHIATVTSGGTTLYTSGNFGESIGITAAREWFASFHTESQIAATVSVQTYLNGTAIGSPVTANVTVTADEGMKPSVSSGWFTMTRVNTTAASGIAAYIKGYSQTQFTFNTFKITMASGAGIDYFSVSYVGGTKTGSGTITTDILNRAGDITFTVRVIDTRGRYAEGTASVTVNDYSPPTLSGISIQRSTAGGDPADEGTYIALTATANISSVGGLNSYELKASYKAQGGSYDTETAMTSGVLLVLGGGLVAANQSYTARIRLTDALGNTASFEQTVPTAEIAFNIRAGGHGAAFGKYAEEYNELQLPAGWKIKIGNTTMTEDQLIDLLNLI